ncbi:MAG: HAD family hydrolase [Parachlamydiaceae bacterium]
MRGTIALDIDGTLTTGSLSLPEKTIKYLTSLENTGWRILFVTGRTFRSGCKALKDVPFPFYFAVQNGAILFEMPSQRIISKKYLDRSIFIEMEAICSTQPSDFVVYSGFENDDQCYFRPHEFSPPLRDYLQRRVTAYNEVWHPLESYDKMAIDVFPSIKCFGLFPSAKELAGVIEKRLGLHVPVIRDPFSEELFTTPDEKYFVVQATHPEISKGQALLDLIAALGKQGKIIAAGDDYNDISMLAVADVAVVMATAPDDLLKKADIIAPSAAQEGIITGLEAAIKACNLL